MRRTEKSRQQDMGRIKQGYSQNTVRIKPEYGRKQTAGLEETAVSKTGWKAARQRMKEIILCRAVFLYAEALQSSCHEIAQKRAGAERERHGTRFCAEESASKINIMNYILMKYSKS
jgi:hypothetical protein